jgi:anti-sigma-K factor RskA
MTTSNFRAQPPEDLAEAEHHVLESAPSEHIYLSSEAEDDAVEPEHVVERFEVKDRRRRLSTELTLYEQGLLRSHRRRGKRRLTSHTIKLRYLDPAPTITRHIALRALYTAAGLIALATAASLLARFETLRPVVVPLALVAAAAAVVAGFVFFLRTHESTVFHTLHGRARAVTLTASFGQFGRARVILPALVRAIEDAEETISDDTALYLREEMREHYRLRRDGVLSSDDCTESTGRILAQFDHKLGA